MSKTYKARLYTAGEVQKLAKAFMDKYNDPGCDGWPYYPEGINVEMDAKTKEEEAAIEDKFKPITP